MNEIPTSTAKRSAHKHHVFIAVILGLFALVISSIVLFVQLKQRQSYSSNATSATNNPTVNVSLKSGDCLTSQTSFICSTSGNPGEIITVTVSAVATDKISALDFYFVYNRASVNSLAFTSATVLTKDADSNVLYTSVISEEKSFNEDKLLRVALIADKPTESLANTVSFRLSFRVLSADPTSIAFVSGPSKAVGPISGYRYDVLPQNKLGTAVDSLANIPHININGGNQIGPTTGVTVHTKVRFNPFSASVPEICRTIKGKVTLASETTHTKLVASDVAFTANADGIFAASSTFNNVPAASDYRIFVKGPSHTQKRYCELEPHSATNVRYNCGAGTIQIATTTSVLNANLVAVPVPLGDVAQQDGVADMRDLLKVKSLFYKTAASDLSTADFNCDKTINGADYSLLLGELQQGYADEN